MASLADDVSGLVVGVVSALGLTGVTVVARKVPAVREGETPPLVCVSLGEESSEPATADVSEWVFGTYPVYVVIVTKSPGKLADPGTIREWRQAVRRRLLNFYQDLATVPALDDVNYEARPPFNATTLDAGYDYSPMLFLYRLNEPRS